MSSSPALGPDAVLVVLCQVPPGFTRALPAPPPERRYYQVETLVFGRAVERATQAGALHRRLRRSGAAADRALATRSRAFGCPILPMRYESAELAKISINCCLVASVSVANTLAELCEAIGADWSEIVPALKLDRRIGAVCLSRARALASPAAISSAILPRCSRFADEHGTDAGVVRPGSTTAAIAATGRRAPSARCCSIASPDATVAVWGLAYKENTHSVKNSPSLATIAQLAGARLRAARSGRAGQRRRARQRRGMRRSARRAQRRRCADDPDALAAISRDRAGARSPRRMRGESCSIPTACSTRGGRGSRA